MRRVLVVLAMLLVGFGASHAGHIGGVFLAGGAPWLALLTGFVVLGAVIVLALWAINNI